MGGRAPGAPPPRSANDYQGYPKAGNAKIQNLKQLQDQQELTKILTKLRDEDR